jgi:hypothetical protein
MAGIEIKKNKKLKQKQKQKQSQNVKQSVVVRIENPKSKPRRRKAVSKPRARDSVIEPAVGVRYLPTANYNPNQMERPQPVAQPIAQKETVGGFYERGLNEEFMRRLLYEPKERSQEAFIGAPSPQGRLFGEGTEDQQQEDIDNQFGEPEPEPEGEPIVQGGAVLVRPTNPSRPRSRPILTKAQKVKLLRVATGRKKGDLEKLTYTEIIDLMNKNGISIYKADHPPDL